MSAASRIDRYAPPPMAVIGDLFSKLVVIYGERHVLARLDSIDADSEDGQQKRGIAYVQEEWRQRLAGISPQAIEWAIESLGEQFANHVPNVLQFVLLCRQYRPPLELDGEGEPKKLGEEKKRYRDPEQWAAAMNRIAEGQAKSNANPKAWAHRVLERARQGHGVTPDALNMAKRALGYHVDETA